MRSVAVTAGCVLAICTLSCNVVRSRGAKIEKKLEAAGMEHRTEEIDDATVSYWVGGSGPNLLLVQGFGASSMWQWHDQIPELTAYHKVIVPDLLWFGGSHSDVEDFSLNHQVRVITALLDRLGVEKTDIVGISYGGFVAYEIASTVPGRVSRVVMVDSPGRAYTSADYDALCKRFGVDDAAEVLIPDTRDDVRRLIDIAYFDPPYTPGFALDDVLSTLYAEYGEEQAQLLNAAVGAMKDLGTRPDGYDAETLVVWGRHDPVFPLALADRLLDRLGDKATLVVIEKAKHAPTVEHPDEFNALVLKFLGE